MFFMLSSATIFDTYCNFSSKTGFFMFSGFDYGTSNCAIGIMKNDDVHLLPLEQNKAFIPSTLYAIERELICDTVAQKILIPELKEDYIQQRNVQLSLARQVRREHDIPNDEQCLFFGQDGFEQYIDMPGEGYFIKSPKSFLGASGLRPEFIYFFEDIVTAMMQNIKQTAEQHLEQELCHTVIGRPVNFQGLNAEKSNQQALEILTTSAKRAGFKSVEFLFEPVAAGLDFEAKLSKDKIVLIVDIGGGTSDCAMVKMGPSYRHQAERASHFIGHTGERIGGNDLDIQLAGKHLMSSYGMNSTLNSGLPMPTKLFWDAVSTNDAGAQAEYNSKDTDQLLKQLIIDTREPELLQRFITLRQEKQNHQVVNIAEKTKIALSEQLSHSANMHAISSGVSVDVSREQFAASIDRPLEKIKSLMAEAVKQANHRPDLIYITGGSAKSLVIQNLIKQQFGDIDIIDGDHFGSVAAGLTRWAQTIFK
jgi:hypothetical chaperone protein